MREDVPLRQLLSRNAARKGIPVSGSFELTPRCSLNCKMCYIRMTPEQMAPLGGELSAREWLDLAQQAKEQGLVFLLLTGGEPFIRRDFFEILEGLSHMGLVVDINSNGTLIDEACVERLLQMPPSKINITLYGGCRETYEKLCGDGSAFDRVIRAIDLLGEAGIMVCLNATLTPENAQDMAAITKIAKDRDLALRTTSYVIPPSRRGERENAYRLPAEQAGCLAANSQLLFYGEDAMRKRAMKQAVMEDCVVHDPETGVSCLAGRSQFWITWNGEMLPCGMLPQIRQKPMESGFEAAWKQTVSEVKALRSCESCRTCSIRVSCPTCAAARYCESGAVDVKPEYLCQFTKAYLDELKKMAE